MTDTFDLAAMIADREEGTPGPWDLRLFQSGTVQVILREWTDGNPNPMAGGSTYGYHSAYMTMYNIGQRDEDDTDNEKYHNARRIARVPKMEAEILRLRAEVDALEAKLAERVTVKPLVEAMEDLLGETRGVLPESADAFYDYQRGEFTEARILSAITTAPITPAEAGRIMRCDEPFEHLLYCLHAVGAEVASGQLDDALKTFIRTIAQEGGE